MTHYSYILYSEKLNSFYKGATRDILDRLHRHNSGQETYTSTRSTVEAFVVL
ncbi:MAG: GIY-YIG nuclease family protein [Fluviicola sp.]